MNPNGMIRRTGEACVTGSSSSNKINSGEWSNRGRRCVSLAGEGLCPLQGTRRQPIQNPNTKTLFPAP